MSATGTRPAGRAPIAPAASTRVQRSEQTRAALLRAASSAICELGMQGASIDRIAAEAGYTKGAFYAHFASKEDMFLTVLDEHFAAELARLDAVLAGAQEPATEARNAAEDFLEHIDADPQWPRLYQEFSTHAARSEGFRVELATRQRDLRARMAEVFERWAASFGVKPPVAPAEIAEMTFFMADGYLLNRIIDPELGAEVYARMFEVFMHGLIAISNAPEPLR